MAGLLFAVDVSTAYPLTGLHSLTTKDFSKAAAVFTRLGFEAMAKCSDVGARYFTGQHF